jgi:ferritin-like metal-binding protein YciE
MNPKHCLAVRDHSLDRLTSLLFKANQSASIGTLIATYKDPSQRACGSPPIVSSAGSLWHRNNRHPQGRTTMSLDNLEKLFLDELKDIYNAEKQLTRALPKMAKAADTELLQEAFTLHLEETKGQIERLEEVFKSLDKTARGKTCKAMEGLIEEGSELMEEDAEPAVMDAGLICAAQKVEHYEIATYGTLVTWAGILGNEEAVALLKANLEEEKATDLKLTELAGSINFEAQTADEEEEAEV